MLTVLSFVYIAWMLLNNLQLPNGGPRVPFTPEENHNKLYYGERLWMWYLLASNIAGVAGIVYLVYS
jgi:hypothetical protein